MRASQTALDALAGDIANVNTPGYRRQLVAFHELLGNSAGGVMSGGGAGAAFSSLSVAGGAMQATGRALDVALPEGTFLAVRGPDGRGALTRGGALELGADGTLQTTTGNRLDPAVKLPAGTKSDDVTIGADGSVLVAGKSAGRLGLVSVRTPQALASAGDGLLTATAASGPARATTAAHVQAGMLEASGVDLGEAMVDLTTAQRSFDLSSKAFQAADEALRIANEVKR